MTHKVLFVCRANLCRSPSAEVLLRVALEAEGLRVHVGSAGLEARDGQHAPEGFYEAAEGRGIYLRERPPVELSAELARAADLMVPMTRDLLRKMVVEDPALWPRSFTLLELVRRGGTTAPPEPGEGLEAWLVRAHASRDRAELLGTDSADDLRDPLSEPEGGAEAMFAVLEPAVRLLAHQLAVVSGSAAS